MTQAKDAKTIIIYKEPHAYCSHPCVTKLVNGDWLVAFCNSTQRQPILHPPGDPQFINLVVRTSDQGQSWQAPRVAPNYDWYGVETPGITGLTNGDVLLNQWRFLWYPLELAKKRWTRDGQTIFIRDVAARQWRPATSEADWQQHPYPYARAEGGAFVQISTDHGYTWELTVPVDITPYQGAFSPKGASELHNGDLLLALGSHDHDPLAANFVVRSHDKGRTWGKPVETARTLGLIFSEAAVAETASGKLLVMSREEVHGYIYQSRSTDGGYTWSPARQLPFWGYPIHCIRLADGRMFIVYGRRQAPFGIRGAISEDEGESWGEELVIRADLPNANLGYPSVIEYAPGQLFTAYYGEDHDGVTCVQGTYFTV